MISFLASNLAVVVSTLLPNAVTFAKSKVKIQSSSYLQRKLLQTDNVVGSNQSKIAPRGKHNATSEILMSASIDNSRVNLLLSHQDRALGR